MVARALAYFSVAQLFRFGLSQKNCLCEFSGRSRGRVDPLEGGLAAAALSKLRLL
jgi:hypothetical protein